MFVEIFNILIKLSVSVSYQIYEALKKEFPADGCIILDECQHMLGILESSYRSRKSDRRNIQSDGKLEHPRSLFTFLVGVLSDSKLRLMLAGTQIKIGSIELVHSAAAGKPTTVDIFRL